MKKFNLILLICLVSIFFVSCAGDQSKVQNISDSSNIDSLEEKDNNTSSNPNNNDDSKIPSSPNTPSTPSTDLDEGSNTDNSEEIEPTLPSENPQTNKEPSSPEIEEKNQSSDITGENNNNENAPIEKLVVGNASNDIATMFCEEYYEEDSQNGKKYSLFKDNKGNYIAGATALCSLNFQNGIDRSKVSNVAWSFNQYIYNKEEYSQNILLHWTNENITNVERCIKENKYIGGHNIKVEFLYNGNKYELSLRTKTLSKLEGRKFEQSSSASYPNTPYNDAYRDMGYSGQKPANAPLYPSVASLPMVAYNYDTTNPKYADKVWVNNKTYAFIRVVAESTNDNYKCQLVRNVDTACPRDLSFQLCNGQDNSCYVTFRGDYYANDYGSSKFKDEATHTIKIPVGKNHVDVILDFSERQGFQYDNGRKMNFPFYFGDPSFELKSNSLSILNFAVINSSHTLLMGNPEFGRKPNIKFTIPSNKLSSKGTNNIALFTLKLGTYNSGYPVDTIFDGWAKLP